MNQGVDSRVYRFRDFLIDVDRRTLLRGGREIPLRPQSFDVLLLLVRRQGRLVTREELLSQVWAGRRVTDASVTQCIVDARTALDDRDHAMIKTVSRRGYRFDVPVDRDALARWPDNLHSGRAFRFLALAAVAAAIVATLWILAVRNPSSSRDQRPVLAVLALESRSKAPEDLHFAAGIQDQLMVALDSISGLSVIAPLSVRKLRQSPFTLADIRRKLGATHALLGNVSRFEDEVRITIQLFDVESEHLVLADAFAAPRTFDALVQLQKDVASRITAAIDADEQAAANNINADARPAVDTLGLPPTDSTLAYEHYLNGLYFLREIQVGRGNREAFEEAAERFQSAAEADPTWVVPRAALGMVYHFRGSHAPAAERRAWFRQSQAEIEKALSLDPDYGPAYVSLGYLEHNLEMDFEDAENAYQRAYELGSRMTWSWGSALLAITVGEFDRAVDLLNETLLRDPLNLIVKQQLALAHECAGRYESAAQIYEELRRIDSAENLKLIDAYLHARSGRPERARELLRDLDVTGDLPWTVLAMTYALLGMREEAETLLARFESDREIWSPAYAETALLLGQRDRAVRYLESAARAEPSSFLRILCLPNVRSLQGDARFDAVMRRVGYD